MKYPLLNLGWAYKHHLLAKGIALPTSQLKSESELLRQSVEAALEKLFNNALADQAFSATYAALINRSPRPVSTLTYEDLLYELASPGQTLITLRPHKKKDVLWQDNGADYEWRGFVRPFPVDALTLVIRRRQIHYSVIRNDILNWDRAATKIPTSSLDAFMRFLKNHKQRIRAIVADEDGVMVIFNVVGHDYPSWRKSTIHLWEFLTKRGVNAERFKLGRLVPISRESRGCGALLYLS